VHFGGVDALCNAAAALADQLLAEFVAEPHLARQHLGWRLLQSSFLEVVHNVGQAVPLQPWDAHRAAVYDAESFRILPSAE
jgi:hypothetical protein